jgi:tetratricopeptide (TPR) repeat protein
MSRQDPTPIKGISYWQPPEGATLVGLDGKVVIPYNGLPVPLCESDHATLNGKLPSYDVVGRGIYEALRLNPDALFADRYARLLSEAYPHYLAELATHIVMLDRKDVEVGYLDRKINYLKIIALLEPDNPQLPLQIGMTLMERGLRLSALQDATKCLYEAEKYLRKALQMAPDDLTCCHRMGELYFLLGRYDDATSILRKILPLLGGEERGEVERNLQRIATKELPFVPVVDYLAAMAVAFERFQQKEWEEAAAILEDILDDRYFCDEFPMPEIHYVLGLCYKELEMPRYAEEYLRMALTLNPDYQEADQALSALVSG